AVAWPLAITTGFETPRHDGPFPFSVIRAFKLATKPAHRPTAFGRWCDRYSVDGGDLVVSRCDVPAPFSSLYLAICDRRALLSSFGPPAERALIGAKLPHHPEICRRLDWRGADRGLYLRHAQGSPVSGVHRRAALRASSAAAC